MCFVIFLFFKQNTAYEMRISDWSSDVCSSDLLARIGPVDARREGTDSASLDRVGGSRLRLEFRRVDELLTTGQRHAGQDALIFRIHVAAARIERPVGGRREIELCLADRKSGVWGKRVSVSLVLGGRRSNKKKK